MNKTYIIDGYNLLHTAPELKRIADAFGIDRARGDLLNAIASFAVRRNCHCTVVFDGVVAKEQLTANVRVVSSGKRSADDIIRQQARQLGRSLVVVSSDLEITGTARTNMATVIGSQEFAQELNLTGGTRKGSPGDGSARPHRIAELRERSEKPGDMGDDDIDEWKRLFGA